MAKKIRRRRYYRSKGRWSANIKPLVETSIEAPYNSSFYGTVDLCQNPAQSDTTVSQQYTIKNIELNSEIEYVTSSLGSYQNIESLIAYVMYVPQGMTVTETYPAFHPEYIMAMRFLGSPNVDTTAPYRNPLRIKTRLARRLQTGDKIILLVTGFNQGTQTGFNTTLKFNGLIRWWSKAN